jgi:hypothetical protein
MIIVLLLAGIPFLYFFGKFSLSTIKLPKGCVHEDNKANSK